MKKPKIITLASIAGNVILLILLLRGCGTGTGGSGTNPVIEKTIVRKWTDTIMVKETEVKHDTFYTQPKLVEVLKYKYMPGDTRPLVNLSGVWTCGDTLIYQDSVERKNNYKARITDTITDNHYVGRGIDFVNLSPRIIEHTDSIIYTDAKENVRLYIGAFAGYAQGYTNNAPKGFTVGPALLLTIPKGIGISYGFDARNNGHQVGLFYKIKLRK